ncbi:MAG: hypothetical protein H6737_27470 [Alphaproteobacteria bacterium]|nr:hypothetical protein [Alphaproteobacteria bacterium]
MEALTEEDRLRNAEQASMLAFLAVILCLMMNCGCFSVMLAVPVSMWALHLARVALDAPDPPELVKAYATPARNTSLVTFLFSGLMTLFIVLYFGTYFLMILFTIGIAVLDSM